MVILLNNNSNGIKLTPINDTAIKSSYYFEYFTYNNTIENIFC